MLSTTKALISRDSVYRTRASVLVFNRLVEVEPILNLCIGAHIETYSFHRSFALPYKDFEQRHTLAHQLLLRFLDLR